MKFVLPRILIIQAKEGMPATFAASGISMLPRTGYIIMPQRLTIGELAIALKQASSPQNEAYWSSRFGRPSMMISLYLSTPPKLDLLNGASSDKIIVHAGKSGAFSASIKAAI